MIIRFGISVVVISHDRLYHKGRGQRQRKGYERKCHQQSGKFQLMVFIGVTILAGKKINGISETYASRLQGLEAEKNKNIEELMYKADFTSMALRSCHFLFFP